MEYYCPCCKGIIKPRAYKKDINYQVQPHFYHETGGCNEETFVHYICKTWLFEKGCKFMVNNTEYEVVDVLTGKNLHTSFGDYRPDIIVSTVSSKIFYFEIRTTNRKTEHYIPKWDELGCDVVEVDTRYFINQKCKNDIPVFNLIYSDGECFIKTYTRNDYDITIAKRKSQWKRQDKLNYKVQWERLDWFWNAMQKYKQGEAEVEDVLFEFSKMDYSDRVWCFYNIKNKSCILLKNEFRECINNCFFDMLDDFSNKYDGLKIKCDQISPLIYCVTCTFESSYLNYELHDSTSIRLKLSPGRILSLDHKDNIETRIIDLKQRFNKDFKKLDCIDHYTRLPYVKSIIPASHWASEYYDISDLYFKIEFEDYIHNNYIKESLGIIDSLSICNISEETIEKDYLMLKKQSINNLNDEFIKHSLKNDSMFSTAISHLREKCENVKDLDLRIRISKGYNTIALLDNIYLVYEHRLDDSVIFGEFEDEFERIFKSKIQKYIIRQKRIDYYISRINSCKNKLWSVRNSEGYITINLHDGDKILLSNQIKIYDFDDEKKKLHEAMLGLLHESEQYYGIRFLREG